MNTEQKKKVDELVGWVAREISKEMHDGAIVKDVFPSEWERTLKRAKQILSHPDLALRVGKEEIVCNQCGNIAGEADIVIPLAEELR